MGLKMMMGSITRLLWKSHLNFRSVTQIIYILNLDSNHQDGSIQVTWTGYSGPITVFELFDKFGNLVKIE
ncbi:hypothetical protein GCM10028803_04400 [Larkinella knui]